jgi:hypothetical protein
MNDNGFWIGWLDLLALRLQLQPIIAAQNRWVRKTRSIPYWTTRVFSSTVTNDERGITSDWNLLHWANFQANRIYITISNVPLLFCFIRCWETSFGEPLNSNGLFLLVVAAGTCVTEPLSNSVHIHHNILLTVNALSSIYSDLHTRMQRKKYVNHIYIVSDVRPARYVYLLERIADANNSRHGCVC